MNGFLNKLFGNSFLLAAKVLKVCCQILPMKSPKVVNDNLLESYGYTLKPLWRNLPPLSQTSLDVSIIIPCFNCRAFIRCLLDSALNQRTRYRYEVIVIDDGSTDETPTILDDYAKHHANLIILHQKNRGAGAARNVGIVLARGGYIGFADSDDYLSPDFVEVLFSRARQTDADMVQCCYLETSHQLERQPIRTPNQVIETKDVNGRWDNVSGYVWRSIYKKKCFEQVRFPERFWFEDMVNRMVFMQTAERIAIVSDVLYYKCTRGESEVVRQTRGGVNENNFDQYWLAKLLVEFTTKELGLPVNDVQYRQLLHEWGVLLWSRTRGLGRERQKVAFCLAGTYLSGLNYRCAQLTDSERLLERTLIERNYNAWMIACVALKMQGR